MDEDCAMSMELYEAVMLMNGVLDALDRIEEVHQKNLYLLGAGGLPQIKGNNICLPGSHVDKDLDVNILFQLKLDLNNMLSNVYHLDDTNTKLKVDALYTMVESVDGIAVGESKGSSAELQLQPAQADIEHKLGSSAELQLQPVQADIEHKLGSSAELQLQPVQADIEHKLGSSAELQLQPVQADIEHKLRKMLLSIYKSGARSTELPTGSFDLGSISFLFDQMWEYTLKLQRLPRESRFLSSSLLTVKTLAHHVSSLELCSEYVDRLCTWVPEFLQRLQRIEKDDEMGKKMMEGVEMEERRFASYKSNWERVCRRNNCISFEDFTTLSSMLFTHYMPGHHPLFANFTRSMQIFSIKITDLKGFEWPLEVYGVVAARDAVDYRRNCLFLRSRDNCQFLTEEDSFLYLNGPSRAIMSADIVQIEFQLKVKGNIKSEDRSLITRAFACDGDSDTSTTHSISGCFCRIELSCENLRDSIQATILSIRLMVSSCLPANGAQVICYSLPEEDAEHKNRVVLLDQKDGVVPVDQDGYLELSRQVVSLQFKGKLEVFTKAGGMSGSVIFEPELSNISEKQCFLEPDSSNIPNQFFPSTQCKVEITIAWSLLVDDEQDMLMMSYTKPFIAPSSFPMMKLIDDPSCVGSS